MPMITYLLKNWQFFVSGREA